ncbi:MAG TPA: NHL repeat-containing protein [Chloroflexota bacterium]|nr:NHL repeat-containing protein [Chloroflexota bacterium]
MTSTVSTPTTGPETTPQTEPLGAAPGANGALPYALLRAGFPYHATLGMRRVTTYCMDIAIGEEGRLFVLCRDDGQGGSIRRLNWDDEDLGTIGGGGRGDGQFLWPVQLLRDRQENLFVSDEGLHRITVLSPDGTFLGKWGEHGQGQGQLNRPSGIAFDADENVLVADTMNHRIQRFTRDGAFLGAFGAPGRGEGELDMPWGVAVDAAGDVYVADWRNDRIQQFDASGRFRKQFGHSGSGPGELRRPAGVAVDADGDVYVADRGNHRVQQFDRTGRFVEEFLGDATLSKIGRIYVMANPKVLRGREMTALGPSKRLRGPASVRFDAEGRMYIPDFGSHRIQVYKKEAYRLTPEQIWPEQKAPFLYNV